MWGHSGTKTVKVTNDGPEPVFLGGYKLMPGKTIIVPEDIEMQTDSGESKVRVVEGFF